MDATVETARPARKLVTVRQISHKEKLRGVFEVVHLDGWTVVVRRDEFEVGQLVVFFEIDSFIPISDSRFWEQMMNRKDVLDGQLGHRVRSAMSGKAISQGIVFALHAFPEIESVLTELTTKLGRDEALKQFFTMSFEKELGVKKWEVVVDKSPDANLGKYPSFFPQPASDRAQNVYGLFWEANRNRVYQVTEKLDGVSMTIYTVRAGSRWYKCLPELPEGCGEAMENEHGRIGVCSRQYDFIDNGENLYWEVAKKLGLPEKLHKIGDNVAVQGELFGSTIQDNSLGLPEGEHTFIVFGIWNIDKQRDMPVKDVEAICKKLDIAHVPVLGYTRLGDFASNLSDLLKKADGTGMNGMIREGFVFKSLNGKEQFKVISNEWLIKTGK